MPKDRLTVKELQKYLRGKPPDMPVFIVQNGVGQLEIKEVYTLTGEFILDVN